MQVRDAKGTAALFLRDRDTQEGDCLGIGGEAGARSRRDWGQDEVSAFVPQVQLCPIRPWMSRAHWDLHHQGGIPAEAWTPLPESISNEEGSPNPQQLGNEHWDKFSLYPQATLCVGRGLPVLQQEGSWSDFSIVKITPAVGARPPHRPVLCGCAGCTVSTLCCYVGGPHDTINTSGASRAASLSLCYGFHPRPRPRAQ